MRDPMKGLEQIIAEAQQEGKFEDLPGKGKPLVIDTSPDAVIKGLLKEANVSFAPEWVRLACDIDRLLAEEAQLLQSYTGTYEADRAALAAGAGTPAAAPAPRRRWWPVIAGRSPGRPSPAPGAGARRERTLAAFQRDWDRMLARYAALLHEGNHKIRRFNQIVPLANRQRASLPVKECLEAFIERFPRLARAEDGTVQPERSPVPASLLVPPPEAEDTVTRKRDVLQSVALQRSRQMGRKPPPIG